MPHESSLNERKMTWQEIKELIEKSGVQPGDEIDRIDISWGSIDDFECNKDDIFGWRIIL